MEGGSAFLRSSSLASSPPYWAPPITHDGAPLGTQSTARTAPSMMGSSRQVTGVTAGRGGHPLVGGFIAVAASMTATEDEAEANALFRDVGRTGINDVPTPASTDGRPPPVSVPFTRAASALATPFSPSAPTASRPLRGQYLSRGAAVVGPQPSGMGGFASLGRSMSLGMPDDLAAAAAELSANELRPDAPEFMASGFLKAGGVPQWTPAPRPMAAPIGPLGQAAATAAALPVDDTSSIGSTASESGSPLAPAVLPGVGRMSPMPLTGVVGWVAADGTSRPWAGFPAPLPTPTGSLGRTAASVGVRSGARVAGRAAPAPHAPAPGVFPAMYKIDPCPKGPRCPHVKEGQGDMGECFYWHDAAGDRRRSATGTYSPAWCRYIPHGVCRFGDGCHHAHNRWEVRFHPSRVHQTTCRDWIKGACTRRFCSYVHEVEPKVATVLRHCAELDDREMVQAVLRMPEPMALSLLQKLQRRIAGSKRNNGWVLEGMSRRPDDPVFCGLAARVAAVKHRLRLGGHAKLSSLLKTTTLRDMMNSVRKVAEEVRETGRGAAAAAAGGMGGGGGGLHMMAAGSGGGGGGGGPSGSMQSLVRGIFTNTNWSMHAEEHGETDTPFRVNGANQSDAVAKLERLAAMLPSVRGGGGGGRVQSVGRRC